MQRKSGNTNILILLHIFLLLQLVYAFTPCSFSNHYSGAGSRSCSRGVLPSSSKLHAFFQSKPSNNRGSQVNVDFFPSGRQTTAIIGEKVSDVATKAEVTIQYKCRKGECGTCEINMDGKWVKACQATIPSSSSVSITIKPPKKQAEHDEKEPTKFFTPKSFMDGIVNNGLGVVGFLKVGMKADAEFEERMRKEKELAEKVAAKKAAKDAGKK